jgi:hypothetical protein
VGLIGRGRAANPESIGMIRDEIAAELQALARELDGAQC